MGYLHGKKQSSFGDTVLEILSVASTLWPILFAAVLGPLLKSIALFRAERGSTLGSLEFLLTSQTTASALKNAMTMGWIGSWAILVLIVWSLSPLGGQAALRSLHRQQSPISTKTPAAYFLGNNESEIQTYYFNGAVVFQGASSHASYISDMRTTLAVSFSKKDTLVSHANSSSPHYNETITGLGGKREASRSGRRDLWRNVRIPFIELLPGYRSDDPHAWIPVSDDEIVPYASLIGLPIRNVLNFLCNTKTVTQANRVRHAHSHPIKGNWTPLSNFRTPQHIFTELTYMGASQHIAEPTALEMYLRDPLALFQRVSGGYRGDYDPMNELGCFVSLPPEIMERRLATALNTAVMSSYPLRILTGGMGLGLEEQSHWQNITASWAEFDTDIYVLNKPWFVTTIVSTVILIICAVANVVIRQLIKAPDFLDNITGLTRDSPFIDLPEDGSGKSGPDRLATVKNVKVRIGDIYPEREVGRIALTTELNSPKLRWNRSYS
ncbi:hypothetical protein ACHAPZ_000275 [Fusarium culmorum]